MSDRPTTPERLDASRDPQTGDVFFPARLYAADGSLRRCEPCALDAVGQLFSWTRMGRRCFGQIDLDGGPRIQGALLGDEHEIGAVYALATILTDDGKARKGYARV